jgi:hypothetical protein
MIVSESTDKATGAKERYFGLQVQSEGDSGKANKQAIGDGTYTNNTTGMGHGEVEASGKWTVTSYLSEAEMKRLIEAICDGGQPFANLRGALTTDGAEADSLRGQLGGSADLMDAARMIAAFISRTGSKGMKGIRFALGYDKPGDMFTEVQLDPKSGKWNYFLGPDGRRQLSDRILSYNQRLTEGFIGPELAGEVMRDVADLEHRLVYLTGVYYPDLPEKLIGVERERLHGYLSALIAIQGRAMAGTTAAATENLLEAGGESRSQHVALLSLQSEVETAEKAADERFYEARVGLWNNQFADTMGSLGEARRYYSTGADRLDQADKARLAAEADNVAYASEAASAPPEAFAGGATPLAAYADQVASGLSEALKLYRSANDWFANSVIESHGAYRDGRTGSSWHGTIDEGR